MRASAAAALLLLAACGKSREEKRFDAFRDACNGLVPGGATFGQAVQIYAGIGVVLDCGPTAPQTRLLGGTDQCSYGTDFVCRVFWVDFARDGSLCGPPGLGGCWFWCEVRVPGTPLGTPSGGALVCGSWFVSGQPFPPL